MTRPCAIDGCNEQIRNDMLVCLDHWNQLPLSIRRVLTDRYRVLKRCRTPRARVEAARKLRQAQQAAISAITPVRAQESEAVE
jgi:hypothetical protein